MLRPQFAEEISGFVREQVPQRLDPRLVRDADVFLTAAVQHSRPIRGDDSSKLGREACLSHTRLAADEYHARVAGSRVIPGPHQDVNLDLSTHKHVGRCTSERVRKWNRRAGESIGVRVLGRLPVELGFLQQDRFLQPGELPAGFDPELLAQAAPQSPVGA